MEGVSMWSIMRVYCFVMILYNGEYMTQPIAFITGISRGIGKALAQKYLSVGYTVIGTSITGEVDFAKEWSELYSDRFFIVALDLSKSQSIADCAERVGYLLAQSDAKIQIYINNAAVLLDEGEPRVDIQKLRNTLEINLIGTIDLTERLLAHIAPSGHIINISSSAGSLSRLHHPDYPAYKISKAALNMFTAYLAFRLGEGVGGAETHSIDSHGAVVSSGTLPQGAIKVSSVHPGRVRTDMGGGEGDMDPPEAAEYIYQTSIDPNVQTGQFWFKGERMGW